MEMMVQKSPGFIYGVDEAGTNWRNCQVNLSSSLLHESADVKLEYWY
jgi:hypothetical protein